MQFSRRSFVLNSPSLLSNYNISNFFGSSTFKTLACSSATGLAIMSTFILRRIVTSNQNKEISNSTLLNNSSLGNLNNNSFLNNTLVKSDDYDFIDIFTLTAGSFFIASGIILSLIPKCNSDNNQDRLNNLNGPPHASPAPSIPVGVIENPVALLTHFAVVNEVVLRPMEPSPSHLEPIRNAALLQPLQPLPSAPQYQA